MAATCAYGQPFTVYHALHFTHLRHDDIRDSFENMLNEVCNDVEIEPHLQQLQGETFDNKRTSTEDNARIDIRANSLWESRYHRAFFDVKLLNPYEKSCPKDITVLQISRKWQETHL